MPSAPSFPTARRASRGDARPGAEPFGQYQATADFVTVTAALAEVIVFNGYPDSIILTAQTGNVLVELADFTGSVGFTLAVTPGAPVETRLKARVVRAVRASGVAAATLHVLGKWADRKLNPGDADPAT